MGNIHIWGQNQIQFKRQVNVLPPDPQFPTHLICQDRLGRVFLGCQFDLYDDSEKDTLIHKLQLRKNQNSYLYPINGCYFQKIKSMCSTQQRCLLTCLRPKFNLRQIWETRLNEDREFSWDQMHLIINNIAHALKTLSAFKQTVQSLYMDKIFITDNVYPLDNLMQGNKCSSENVINNYLSPQDLATRKKSYFRYQQGRLYSNLFTLGIIALQLCHMKGNLQEIYQNVSIHKSGVKLNSDKLQLFVDNISQIYLQTKIRILTNPIPEERKNIYSLIQKEKITQKNVQFLYKKIQSLANLDNKITKHQKNQQTIFLPLKTSRNSQTQVKHTKIGSDFYQNQKPRIHFNFINEHNQLQKDKQNENYSHISFCYANKENLQNQSNKQKISIQQKSMYDNSWRLQSTPQKRTKKKEFSTIKQESDADQCLSSINLKYCDQLCASGKFQGLYENGKRQGWGKFYFKQGSVYEGEWKGDFMNGYGKLYYPNGKIAYEGEWTDNQFNGHGKVYNCSPVILNEQFNYKNFNQLSEEWIAYEGNLVKDKKEGFGCLSLSNQQYFEGQFLNDQLDGQGTFFTKKGLKIRGIWKNSQLIHLL